MALRLSPPGASSAPDWGEGDCVASTVVKKIKNLQYSSKPRAAVEFLLYFLKVSQNRQAAGQDGALLRGAQS